MKKFSEPPDTAVFATKYVLKKEKPILHVAKFEDGFFQFSSGEIGLEDDELMIVSLEEVIRIDPTVQEIADLQPGFYAERKEAKSPWRFVGQS